MTVSNVIRGKGSVSAATRERVMKYIQELNYQPNLIARSLSSGRSGVIGLVVNEMSNAFYAEVMAIAERLAYARGLRIFVTTLSREDESLPLLKDLALRRVDGIIATSGSISPQAINAMSGLHLPVVHCFWETNLQAVDYYVPFAFEQAGRLAIEHLLELGHRRFGLVGHPHGLRSTGFLEALAQHGITLAPEYIQKGDSSQQSGKAAGLVLLKLPQRPTAIFATNDMMALGVMTAAWELGLRIPQELSVIGHDDLDQAAYSIPPLTSIRIDRRAMLSASLDLLLDVLAGKQVTAPQPFPASLTVRFSSGPCPQAPS